MSGLAHLRTLARGQRPPNDGLLGNTRCAWGGTELLGEEALLAAFATQPFKLEGELQAVETAQGAALIGPDRALYADLYDGRIGRLWQVGGEAPHSAEPAIDVAFDADMRQERGCLSFRVEDHPCLDTEAAQRLLIAGRAMVEARRLDGKLRVRGYVVRACSGSQGVAALIALHSLSNEPSRTATSCFAIVGLNPGGDDFRAVCDQERPRAWTPRL